MKTTSILILFLLAFGACRERAQGFDAYFCTSTESANNRYLYIDKEKAGILPYAGITPDCNDRSSRNTLNSGLTPGKHLIEVKDTSGNILFSGRMKVSRHGQSSSVSSSTRKKRWGLRVKVHNECLIANIRY